MSSQNKDETLKEETSCGQRWMIPMDFSIQANAALEWVISIMKPCDYIAVVNVLNLKAPTYAHDIARNERMKRDSSDKLEAIETEIKEKGFKNVVVECKRGEPTKVVCAYATEKNIDTIVMGRRGMSNLERVMNGSVSSYVLSNAPCAVCLMGKDVEERAEKEKLKQGDKEISELSASASEGEGDGDKKMPFFLPRKHSIKNYYTDSD